MHREGQREGRACTPSAECLRAIHGDRRKDFTSSRVLRSSYARRLPIASIRDRALFGRERKKKIIHSWLWRDRLIRSSIGRRTVDHSDVTQALFFFFFETAWNPGVHTGTCDGVSGGGDRLRFLVAHRVSRAQRASRRNHAAFSRTISARNKR